MVRDKNQFGRELGSPRGYQATTKLLVKQPAGGEVSCYWGFLAPNTLPKQEGLQLAEASFRDIGCISCYIPTMFPSNSVWITIAHAPEHSWNLHPVWDNSPHRKHLSSHLRLSSLQSIQIRFLWYFPHAKNSRPDLSCALRRLVFSRTAWFRMPWHKSTSCRSLPVDWTIPHFPSWLLQHQLTFEMVCPWVWNMCEMTVCRLYAT